MSERQVYEFMGRKVRASGPPDKLLAERASAARIGHTRVSTIESQEAYILELALFQSACPVCPNLLNRLEATTDEVYDLAAADHGYKCGDCGTPLRMVVPMMSTAPWLWVKVK